MADKSFFIDTTKCTACRGGVRSPVNSGIKTLERKLYSEGPTKILLMFRPQHLNWWRFNEVEVPGGEPKWYFFPTSADTVSLLPVKRWPMGKAKGAIIQDEKTGGSPSLPQKWRWNRRILKKFAKPVPRYPKNLLVRESWQNVPCVLTAFKRRECFPLGVKTCPTGAMNFGDRKEIVEKANKRLAEVKGKYKDASFGQSRWCPGDLPSCGWS